MAEGRFILLLPAVLGLALAIVLALSLGQVVLEWLWDWLPGEPSRRWGFALLLLVFALAVGLGSCWFFFR